MSAKLTAKLSDGTEWIVNYKDGDYYLKKYGDICVHLSPLKPEPPKELWVAIEKSTGLCGGTRLSPQPITPDYLNFRYILAADEPKQERQAREWWDVRFKETGNAYTTCETEAEARETAARYDNLFEAVHVREVLG